ncbi:hypothetical protein ACFP1I_17245 [Dyadobacter subterraneus]|uniref:Uncharacterized protein n=1 Tax=Dyadobacter subterraneus TaxID=2773304 RepID=A0ABR9WHK1_9BACT|nr:hypothetical protein [Dyadobacter subterraneus]MBE9464897.1 hypothetical protein [Dyadobacter subterraneus]
MTKLNNDWLTEGIFDFEYKKYVLMAYLQHIDGEFNSNRLYPYLQELKLHLDSCQNLQANKNAIQGSFPKKLKGMDLSAAKLVYEDTLHDDAYLSQLNYILDFAIPRFSKSVEEGSEKFSEVGENIKISPVGIVPLRVEEGYLFFLNNYERMITIFRYELALYNQMRERSLKTVFVDSVRISIGTTLEQIKIDLTRRFQAWPNPATYMIQSKYDYPLKETLLPVVQRLMVKQMNVA